MLSGRGVDGGRRLFLCPGAAEGRTPAAARNGERQGRRKRKTPGKPLGSGNPGVFQAERTLGEREAGPRTPPRKSQQQTKKEESGGP